MQDLILDQMIGKQLLSFNKIQGKESDYTSTGAYLTLVFDTGTLDCYHEQECCENVAYLDSTTDQIGVVKSYNLQAESEIVNDEEGYSQTMTYLTLHFESGESNTFSFQGESNGYYSESISYRWI
jgi:hypothetical protein